MALISLALPCYAADWTTGEAGDPDNPATNIAFENINIGHATWVLHEFLVTGTLTTTETVGLYHGYVPTIVCTDGDEDIYAYCVKFGQSETAVADECGTIYDLGGVEYEIDCGVLSDGRYTNPKCNRCEGTE